MTTAPRNGVENGESGARVDTVRAASPVSCAPSHLEAAFAVDEQKQEAWKPELEILLGNSAAEDEDGTEKDETCQAACCRRDNVYDDMYIDRKQRTEYIDRLLPKGEHNDQQPSISILRRPLKELLRTSADKELSITPDELIIMSYRVFGFILRTRKWGQLSPPGYTTTSY
jgi:hypothetical protein